jgi:hypothetical protein
VQSQVVATQVVGGVLEPGYAPTTARAPKNPGTLALWCAKFEASGGAATAAPDYTFIYFPNIDSRYLGSQYACSL